MIPAQSVNEKLTLVAGLIPGLICYALEVSRMQIGPGISKPYIGPGDEKEDPGLILCGPIGLGRYARHALG